VTGNFPEKKKARENQTEGRKNESADFLLPFLFGKGCGPSVL